MADAALPTIALNLLQESALIVAIFDDRDVLQFANAAFESAFHWRADGRSTWMDMMRDNHAHARGSAMTGGGDFELWLASARSRRGKQPFRAFEGELRDGRWIWMTETTIANGWMLCVASDITATHQDGRTLRLTRDQALRAAHTDALSGISNRAFMMQRLAQLLSVPGSLALVLLDLDHFKRINDHHGHPAGDAVIRDFARHLQASVRRGDSCGRIGGEEFMLLLPHCDQEQAQRIVQRLLALVRASSPLPLVPQQRYSASAGLALRRSGEDAAQLYARADQALYRAKSDGRDCVRCAEAPLAT